MSEEVQMQTQEVQPVEVIKAEIVKPARRTKYTKELVAELMLKADKLKSLDIPDKEIAKELGIMYKTYVPMVAKHRKDVHAHYREKGFEFVIDYVIRKKRFIRELERAGRTYQASQADDAFIEKLQSFGFVPKVSDKVKIEGTMTFADLYTRLIENKDDKSSTTEV